MKKELIRYRQRKGRETLEDAALLFHSGRLFSALNRIYYALFYEVIALLLTADLSSAKHTGVRALFNEHFVKTGKVPVELKAMGPGLAITQSIPKLFKKLW